MSQSIDILMTEHRLIEKVLGSLETFVEELTEEKENRTQLGHYVEFFREFADRCHHGKEEDRLFVQMSGYGFSREWGPLKVMLQEHNQGRARVRSLAAIAEGEGPLSEREQSEVKEKARDFIALLRAHIQKEDNVLYPSAKQAVPAEVLDGLVEDFERFEREVMGEGAHEKMHALADSLMGKHPPRS
jgi:hemerythrin-like domain-containing protein